MTDLDALEKDVETLRVSQRDADLSGHIGPANWYRQRADRLQAAIVELRTRRAATEKPLVMTSPLRSIAERIWSNIQSLPYADSTAAYVERLRALSRELMSHADAEDRKPEPAPRKQGTPPDLTQAQKSAAWQCACPEAFNYTSRCVKCGMTAPSEGSNEPPKDVRMAAVYAEGVESIKEILTTPKKPAYEASNLLQRLAVQKAEASKAQWVQCISCGQEAMHGRTSEAQPCWLGPAHVWEDVKEREHPLKLTKVREHILLTAHDEYAPTARLTSEQARELGIQLIMLSSGYGK